MANTKPNNKIYYALALLFTVTLGTIIFIVQYKTNKIINELTLSRAKTANQSLAIHLSDLEITVLQLAEATANNETIISILKSGYYESLPKVLHNFVPSMDFVSICDPHGIVIASSYSGIEDDNISEYTHIQAVLRTGNVSSSISYLPFADTLAINGSAPIHDGAKLIGIASCGFDLRKTEYLDTYKEKTGYEATIFLGSKRINTTITDQSGERIIGTTAPDYITETVINRNSIYTGKLEIFGKTYGVCYSPLVNNGQAIGLLFSGIEIGSTIKNQRIMNILIILTSVTGIAASMLFMIYSAGLTRRYSQSLEKQLNQQTLMANISRNFLSEADTSALITQTLSTVGIFMEITQALLYKLGDDGCSLRCCNEWIDPKLGLPSKIGSIIILQKPLLAIINNLQPGTGLDACISSNNPVHKAALSFYRKNSSSYISAPIFVKGKIRWIIDFSRMDKNRIWNESEINLATLFANTLSGVFERDAMEQQSSIVENSPHIILYSDLEGNLAYASPAVIAATGYSAAEINAGGLNLIFDEQTIDNVKNEYIPKTLANGIDKQEIFLYCKDGRKRILQMTSFITKGGLVAAIAVDLTEIRALETELIAAKELAEKASRAKSEFLSRMSHELRTPMNAIMGLTEIAKKTNDMQKIKSYLEKTGGASKNLMGIINDILDMTSIEYDNITLIYDEFNFEKAIITAVETVNFYADEKNQDFIVNIDNKIPISVMCDERRFSQVVINLLSNAVKFTHEGGSIALNITATDISGSNYTILTEVSDNGIGIPKEAQDKLYDPFEQIDGGVARKYGGTGLGLYISKQIIDQMGGKIWVDSEPGQGSKFSFTLTVLKGNDVVQETLPSGIKILAAGSSAGTREYFKNIMNTYGINCDTAENSKQVQTMISECRAYPYNIIFIDYQLQGMPTVELVKNIQEIAESSIIVLIGNKAVMNNMENDAAALGIKHTIVKPVFPSALMQIINSCITKSISDEAEKTGKTSDGFKTGSILIAEDVELNRMIIEEILSETGLAIEFAENGQQAVDMYKENPEKYSLIFMDINMPEVDGYEATRRIRSMDNALAKQIPIIAMTANVFPEDIERCLAQGMNAHVGKPLDHNDIFNKLRKFLPPDKE